MNKWSGIFRDSVTKNSKATNRSEQFLYAPNNLADSFLLADLLVRRRRHDWLATAVDTALLRWSLGGISSEFLIVLLFLRSFFFIVVVFLLVIGVRNGVVNGHFGQGLGFAQLHLLHHLLAPVHVSLVVFHLASYIFLALHRAQLALVLLLELWLDEGSACSGCLVGRVVIHRLAAHASSVPLHVLLLIVHKLVESQLSAEALAPVSVLAAHRQASSTASDWLHDLPVEHEVHGVSLAE